MTTDEIKVLIEAGIEGAQVTVNGDNGMFDTTVVADQFDGLAPVKKQQMVYATVNTYITSGEIHALSIKAYTPKEWATASKLLIG
ncbi:MAG: BolA family transcriptional regulator [gamma proteobacterium symbiont of Bathyaustriella thionipta]|nr:BolA family transcriptional regulator [gamma proteobacterium symbiont of Bathyaustriella thionipta]MCU7948423.1 BolA family transcriptional regulator [gamma proteobacterium symbiont of Bathyaustriella thionipta]MCU7954122.1 BolA family transcriptional regulator [gamma proteobacterium symbiont of Bathyaustriella thionipta]MCU7955415.1 BolA family transcriptional regulator [gamma proteobacterium symbiont of Bathyaustriella thionipta]MCU7968817.1 BolA family transcriptional regulator [gamma pro